MAATLTAENELTYASFPIERVEQTADGNVMVWGKATDDTVDSDQQIIDADFAAKAIDEWMASGPNVRVQHQAQRDPAGVGISVDRDGSSHWVKSKIIEPVAKQLVLGGALRAYSVGIARPTIVRDALARGGRITDGQIVEISLVDRPANKNCGIQLVKAASDGTAEWVGKVFGSDDMIAKAASAAAPPGDVTLTVPADIQMTFTPLDMAKVIARRNGSDFIAKGPVSYGGGVPAGSMPKADDADEDEDVEKGKLSAEARNALPDSDFVFPGKRKYPIHDKSHARNALSRVATNGTPEEQAKVRAAVAARYPGIGKKAAKKAAAIAAGAIPDVTKPVEKTDSDSDGKTKAMCMGCGAKQNSEHGFCSECGHSMAGAPQVEKNHDFACLSCRNDLDKGEKFCTKCGTENPGYNPMADLKIPANKSEGSRVAAEPEATEAAEKAMKPKKGKKGKGKPFGGNQAAPFGKDKDDDGDDKGAEKVNDAPLTAVKGLGGKTSAAIPVSHDAPEGGGRKKRKKGPKMPRSTPADGAVARGDIEGLPGHRDAPEQEVFERSSKFADPAVGTAMRLKNLGIESDMGYAHDLTCPAFSWEDVAKSYPTGLDGLNADAWQQKALEAASSAPLAQAQAASRLGQAAFTIKSSSAADLADVKNDMYKAFRDANPGPGSFPTPGHVMAQSFQRPKITTGRAAYSHQYDSPNSAKVPQSGIAASQFDHGFIQSGRAEDSPANKGIPYPKETGVHMNLDYSNVQKEQIAQAFMAMHDHFDRVFPGVCPMNTTVTSPPAHQLDAAKADEPDVTKKVAPDGMSKKDRKKLTKKLTKKVMSGKMPLDQARVRMGKKPKMACEPLSPQKSETTADVAKGEITPKPLVTRKALAVELRRAQKTSDKKIAALTKAVNLLADQPDPATQAFKGMAVNPIRTKSAGPAGVQSVAEVAERTQVMMLHELEAQWRNSTDPAQREAAWNASLKMRGLPGGS